MSLSTSTRRRITIRTTTAMISSLLFSLLCTISILQSTNVAAATKEEHNNLENNNNNNIISIPLIPHHVNERRKRQRNRRSLSSRYNIADNNEHQQKKENDNKNTNNLRHHREMDQVEEGTDNSHHHRIEALYQGYGTHYMDLWCGTPPQRQTVIVDTGSSRTGFPCTGCPNCGELVSHIDDLFRYDQSSTFHSLGCSECSQSGGRCQNNQCRTSMSYQEGSSWSAFEVMDHCYMGGPHGEPLLGRRRRRLEEENNDPNSNSNSSNNSSENQDKEDVTKNNVDKDKNDNDDESKSIDLSLVDDNNGLDPGFANIFGFDLTFGCQDKLTGLFATQLADGILGMNNDHRSSFWSQLYNANIITQKVFAMCFWREDHVDRAGSESGALTMGGVDKRLHNISPMVYITELASYGSYSVRMKKLYLKENNAATTDNNADTTTTKFHLLSLDQRALGNSKTIIDSGTTDTYMPSKFGNEFKQKFKQITGFDYSNNPLPKEFVTEEKINQLPTLIIQLQGDSNRNAKISNNDPSTIPGLVGKLDPDEANQYDVLLEIPPSHYIEYDEFDDTYVPRLYFQGGYSTTFGANTMMGHDIAFYVEEKVIGIAKSDCDYTKLIEDNGYDVSAVQNVTYKGKKALAGEMPKQIDETEKEKEVKDEGST